MERRFGDLIARQQQLIEEQREALRRQGAEHPMEQVGARLRGLMPWLQEKRLVDRSKN